MSAAARPGGPALWYGASLAALALIEVARNSFGDANLPPLMGPVRLAINLLFLNLAAAYWCFVGASDRPLSRHAWAGFALVGAWLCVATFPVFSGDLLEYLVRGRIVAVHHESPYRMTPGDYPGDLLTPFSTWRDNPDSYGPLFVWIEALPAFLAPGSVNGMVALEKLVFLGFMAWAAVSFSRVAARVAAGEAERHRLVALFALNPLWIVASAVDGHNDVVMVAFTVAAVDAFLAGRSARATVLWTAAFLVKYTVLLVLPPLALVALVEAARRSGWGRALAGLAAHAALAAAFTVACFAPLWDGRDTFLALIRASAWFYTNTLPYAFHRAAALAGLALDPAWVKRGVLAGYAFAYAWLLAESARTPRADARRLVRILCGVYLCFYLTVTIPFGMHYLLWALPWLALSRWPHDRWLVTLYSFAGLFSYFKRMNVLLVLAAVLYSVALIARGRRAPANP